MKMVKNKNRKHAGAVEAVDSEIKEQAEKLFKKILKVMSWTVGISFIFIIILPLFENVMLDNITKILFYIGAINLIAFTIIEFVSDSVKNKIQKILKQTS